MQFLKFSLGILFIVSAWVFIFNTRLIFVFNAWMRDRIFNDKIILFSGRRMAVLLLILGILALFSGIEGMVKLAPIKPNVANIMLTQANADLKQGRYRHVVNRCRELVRSDPKNIEAWKLLASAWWAMGEKELARQALESIVRIDPDYLTQNGNLAKILEKRPN